MKTDAFCLFIDELTHNKRESITQCYGLSRLKEFPENAVLELLEYQAFPSTTPKEWKE